MRFVRWASGIIRSTMLELAVVLFAVNAFRSLAEAKGLDVTVVDQLG